MLNQKQRIEATCLQYIQAYLKQREYAQEKRWIEFSNRISELQKTKAQTFTSTQNCYREVYSSLQKRSISDLSSLLLEVRQKVSLIEEELKLLKVSSSVSQDQIQGLIKENSQLTNLKSQNQLKNTEIKSQSIVQEQQNRPLNKQKQQIDAQTKEKSLFSTDLMKFINIKNGAFKIDGLSIQLIDQSPYWNQVIFNYPLVPFSSSQFTIKIQRSKRCLILIGVLDYEKRKDQLYSHDSDQDMVCYYGYNTKVFPGGYQGLGFKENSQVTVKIDRNEGEIFWFVNDELQARLKHKILLDQKRLLMPFVQMNQTNDVVAWVCN